MALFSPQPTGPSGSAVTPSAPAQQPSPIGMDLAKMGASMLPTAQQRAASAAAQQKTEIASSAAQLTQQQLQISDAVDGGRMSSSEGRRRMRVLYSNALASNPAALDELSKAQKSVMTTSGLGKVVAEGTREEQQYFDLEDKAMSAGFIRPGMSDGEKQGGVEAWQEFEHHKEILSNQQSELTYRRGLIGEQSDKLGLKNAEVTYARNRLGLSTDQIRHQEAVLNVQEKKDQRQARQALAGLAEGNQRNLRNDWTDLNDRVQRGEITAEQALNKMDNDMLNLEEYRTALGPQAGGEYTNNLLSGTDKLYEVFKGRITGSIDNDVMQSRIDNITLTSQAEFMDDPEVARMVATSSTFPNADFANLGLSGKKTAEFVNQGQTEGGAIDTVSSTNSSDKEAKKLGLNIIKDNMKALTAGTAQNPDATQREVTNFLNKTLKGLDSYGYAAEEPEQFNDIMDFIASPEYGEYVSANGTGLNQNSAVAARGMVEQQYMDKVTPILEREWKNANVQTSALGNSGVLGTTAQTESTSNVIEPVWTGSGVMFRAKSGSNARVGAKVRDLNKNMGPIVNRLIKAGAHLEGNNDYKSQWDNNFSSMFGENSQEEGN